ncbi:MAG: hypothetical protein SFX73_04615 [Kofleriaceae bacterium]|nr:hypothetical protein [Kofleriaceae bacterium]
MKRGESVAEAELAPAHWTATRAHLNPDELDMQLGSFTVPPSDQP